MIEYNLISHYNIFIKLDFYFIFIRKLDYYLYLFYLLVHKKYINKKEFHSLPQQSTLPIGACSCNVAVRSTFTDSQMREPRTRRCLR